MRGYVHPSTGEVILSRKDGKIQRPDNGNWVDLSIVDKLEGVTLLPIVSRMVPTKKPDEWARSGGRSGFTALNMVIYEDCSWIATAPNTIKKNLEAHAKSRRNELINADKTVTVSGTAYTVASDGDSRDNFALALQGLILLPDQTERKWTTKNAGRVLFSRADFITLALTVGGMVDALHDTYDDLKTEIESGTITTCKQIDEYAWPGNVT